MSRPEARFGQEMSAVKGPNRDHTERESRVNSSRSDHTADLCKHHRGGPDPEIIQ